MFGIYMLSILIAFTRYQCERQAILKHTCIYIYTEREREREGERQKAHCYWGF
jgi:hypothetical protein